MRSAWKIVIVLITVFAVGGLHLFGVPGGYVCGCRGDVRVPDSECVAEHCHPGESHADGCDTDGGAPARGHHDHHHKEVRDAAKFVGACNLGIVPAPLMVEMPPLEFVVFNARAQCWKSPVIPLDTGPGRSPPIAVLVARTVVRLV